MHDKVKQWERIKEWYKAEHKVAENSKFPQVK